ncbi:MAG: NAD(P)-dependent alcohol dehydrogenase [Tatlockia sp.]|nr:NAD(P)-dependent alcohol dehydrogenase [Tatlockia sp.]
MINAFAALEVNADLQPFTYVEAPLAPEEVVIAITHCGICHTDIHMIDNDWELSQYPLVPGHEIIGTVIARGNLVTDLNLGQRVGLGWQVGACFHCDNCKKGNENYCGKHQPICIGRFGGFATHVTADHRFVFPIPEGMDSAKTAPLLCAGITVFNAMIRHNVLPTHHVGIIGLGGLGHIALQFAKAFGCEVSVFSSSKDKEQEAYALGATHFVLTQDEKELEKRKDSLDFLLSTIHVDQNWSAYLNLLHPLGHLCFVGVPPQPLNIAAVTLIDGGKSVSGSYIGNRQRMREMLNFAALHKIAALVEVVPLSQVNDAIAKVRSNKARYRMVVKIEEI